MRKRLFFFLAGTVVFLVQADWGAPLLTPTPTAAVTPTALVNGSPLNSIALVSDPLGNKIAFRATVALPSIVKIKIHDHFYAPVTVLQKTGTGCFDVLWKVKKVPDGIYYYDTEIKGVKSGTIVKLPMQKVIVTQ